MVRHVHYTITRGQPFERLLIVKLRRTHRVVKPSEARAALRTSSGAVIPIEATVTSEWGVRLYLSEEETADLPLGELEFDVIAYMDRYAWQPSPIYQSTGGFWQPIAKGTLTVEALDTISPIEDDNTMRLSYKQRTDLHRTFAWYTDDDVVPRVPAVAQDAYLVAVDETDTVAMKLRWFPTVPDEATIAALPANERGYLAPVADGTVQMHISDSAVLTPGLHRFTLMVKVSGNWEELVKGTLQVEFNPASVIERAQVAAPMVLTYRQRTDYRRRFSWYAAGDTDQTTPLSVTNAYLVAGSDGSAPVAHIRWFASPPDEAAIRALPANERGYLAPVSGATMELHLSDALTIPPGQYSFSIMANQAGDWAEFASGTLVVEFNPASLVAVPT